MFTDRNVLKKRHTTGGLAQAGQWLARKFVQIWKFCARPNGSESPAFAKPLGRYLHYFAQPARHVANH